MQILLTDMHRQHHHSTLTHTAGTSLHCKQPTNTPRMPDYHQSLFPSFALELNSFPRITAAMYYDSWRSWNSNWNEGPVKNKFQRIDFEVRFQKSTCKKLKVMFSKLLIKYLEMNESNNSKLFNIFSNVV